MESQGVVEAQPMVQAAAKLVSPGCRQGPRGVCMLFDYHVAIDQIPQNYGLVKTANNPTHAYNVALNTKPRWLKLASGTARPSPLRVCV